MDFQTILDRMLANVPSTVDKREGSVVYDALAPAAREFAKMYEALEEKLKNTFAGTADREWLIKRGAEIGIEPSEATYAVRKGVFTPTSLDIQLGERFSYNDLNFIVIEKLEDGVYALQCEEKGVNGNFGTGSLIPIQYVQGLETAILTSEVIIYGEDEESTEDFRARYFATLPTMTLDGNIAQYSKWCREYAGIGNFKIFPLWNGKNTVKVSILSSENTIASQSLIDEFQNYLDPNSEGLGMGKAPIGAIVTVSTATEKPIDVTAQVMLRAGYSSTVNLEEELIAYLKTLNYVRNAVSYVGIAAIINNNEAVEVGVDVTVNGGKEPIELGEEEIAKLGTLTIEVVE